MLRFRLFGFPIAIHWMFWVTAAMLGGGLSAKSPEETRYVLLFVVAALISVLIHELGHAFLQRRYGARSSILLYTFGGQAIPEGGRFTRQQGILISLAGPVVQLVLGFLVRELLSQVALENRILITFLYVLSYISIFWALLNLIPIFPLDGGRVLGYVLGPSRFRTTLQVSIVCAVGLIIWALSRGSIYGPIILGLLTYENIRRLRGERPISILDPVR